MCNPVNCGLCLSDVRDMDSITCYGLCGRTFHLTCLANENNNYKKAVVEYLRKIQNLQWYCDNCIPHTINGLVSTFKECASYLNEFKRLLPILSAHCNIFSSHANPSFDSASTSTNKNNSNTTVNGESQQHISVDYIDMHVDTAEQMNNDNISNSVPLSSFVLNNERVLTPNRSSKRKLNNVNSPMPTKVQRTARTSNLSQSTTVNFDSQQNSQQNLPSNTASLPADDSPKYIYLSGFKPNTDTSAVMNHLNSIDGINASNIQCKKLVSEHNNRQRLTFVSFKLTVPSSIFDVVMCTQNWPKNTIVREFVNKITTLRNNRNSTTINRRHNIQNGRSTAAKAHQQQSQRYVRNSAPPTNQQPQQNQLSQQNQLPFFPNHSFATQPMLYPYYLPQMPPIYNHHLNHPPPMMF